MVTFLQSRKAEDHMKQKFKRRNYFINKEFQGKYLFNAFLLLALGSILFVFILRFFSSNTLSIVYENYHLELGTTPDILLNKILNAQWLFLLLGGFSLMGIVLLLSHRIAGPFFRFEKTLDSMIRKDLTQKIFLRTKDEGKVLAGKINSFNQKLGGDISKIKYNSKEIDRFLEKTPKYEKDTESIGVYIETIKRMNQKNLAILNEYKYENE